MRQQDAGSPGDETPRDTTIEHLAAFSELASLGHSRERLAELAPKVRELYGMIEKIRSADVGGHEMAVNYWTAIADHRSYGRIAPES